MTEPQYHELRLFMARANAIYKRIKQYETKIRVTHSEVTKYNASESLALLRDRFNKLEVPNQ